MWYIFYTIPKNMKRKLKLYKKNKLKKEIISLLEIKLRIF